MKAAKRSSLILGTVLITSALLVGGTLTTVDASQVIAEFLKVNGYIRSANGAEVVDINRDKTNPGIELRDMDTDGLRPYIDFSNDATTDADARIQLINDNLVRLGGADLHVPTKIKAGTYCDTTGANCKTIDELGGGVPSYKIKCSDSSSITVNPLVSCTLVCDPDYGVTSVGTWGDITYISSNQVKVTDNSQNVVANATCVSTG